MQACTAPPSKATTIPKPIAPSSTHWLAAVILIGLLVEGLVFTTLEGLIVRRWGMQQ